MTVAAAALSACGGGSGGDRADAVGTQPTAPVTTTEPAADPSAAGTKDSGSLSAIAADTQSVVEEATSTAKRLADNPKADVQGDLDRLSARAQSVAARARSQATPAAGDAQAAAGDAQAQADQGAQAAADELAKPENRKLRDRLAAVNDRVARTADRLQRVTDPKVAAKVARTELGDAQGDLQSVVKEAGPAVPDNVRRQAEQLRDRIGSLTG